MTAARDRVADAALAMFSERGYDGVSMRDLAAELQIQAPSIYSHFSSKSNLLSAVIEPALHDIDRLLGREPVPVDEQGRAEWLHEYLMSVLHHRQAWILALMDAGVRADPIIGPQIRERRGRVLDLLTRLGDGDAVTAQAALGAIVYPILLSDARPDQLPQVLAAAERVLGPPPDGDSLGP